MSQLFNSSLEMGVRMAFILLVSYPRKYDLQRLVYLDYATIYSGDMGGPQSLHTPVPLRGGEYLTRREVIESGLYLMTVRSIVDVTADKDGIQYSAGENAASLIGLMSGPYSEILYDRAKWAVEHLSNLSENEIEDRFGRLGILWGSQLISETDSPGATP